MKTAFATLITILFLCGTAVAQTTCFSQNANVVPIDTVRVTISLAPSSEESLPTSNSTSTDINYKTGRRGALVIDMIYGRVGDRIECGIEAESIRFEGDDPDAIDRMSTMEIFNMISQVAIGQGLNLKYATCSGTCGTNLFRVNLPACVERTGKGNLTRFSSCRPGYCCTRIYSLCCPDGSTAPAVRLVGTEGGGDCAGIGGTCESTCP